MTEEQEQEDMCRCGVDGSEYHECPYKQETNNDDEQCNCCDECTENCASNI